MKILSSSVCFLLLAASLGLSVRADILPADRRTVWNPGLNAVGGIPNRTNIFRTLVPRGGTLDDTAAIQNALDNCPSNQVVLLGPGTFIISDPGLEIVQSGVTLRGSGPDQTKLVQRTNAVYPVVIIGSRWIKHTVSRPLIADGVKGAYSISVSNTAGLKIGELITLNQLADETRSDTVPPIRKIYWGVNATDPNGGARRWFCEQNRPLGQTLEITGITSNQLTFSTPLHIGFETALQAHINRLSNDDPDGTGWGANWNTQIDATRYSGIENLYVAYGNGGDGGGNIHLFGCACCWVRNVESELSVGHSCNLETSFRCEVRDSYFHTTQDPNPGGAGYGIGVNVYSSDCLYENNIVWSFNKLTVGRASGGGNVFAYNYLQDGFGAGYVSIPEVGCGANHYAGAHMELFEGNESFNADSESYWGNPIYQTFYRNHFTGLRISAPPLQLEDAINRRIVGVDAYAWWFSFVGNVLGFDGMPLLSGTDPYGDVYNQTAFIYQTDAAFYANGYGLVPAWDIGHGDGLTAPAPLALARTYRHGNYDYVSNAIAWNPTNADHALPASLYLPAKPAFFGTNAWPWVTPENAPNTTVTLPAKVRFNAIISTTATNYAAWRKLNFEGTALASNAISGPLADPDRAGVPNLLRYAFGFNARGPVGSATAVGTTGTGAQRCLTLAFNRRAAAADLSYVVEGSSNLITWSTVATYAPGSPARVTAQDNVTFGSAAKHFLRVRVATVP